MLDGLPPLHAFAARGGYPRGAAIKVGVALSRMACGSPNRGHEGPSFRRAAFNHRPDVRGARMRHHTLYRDDPVAPSRHAPGPFRRLALAGSRLVVVLVRVPCDAVACQLRDPSAGRGVWRKSSCMSHATWVMTGGAITPRSLTLPQARPRGVAFGRGHRACPA